MTTATATAPGKVETDKGQMRTLPLSELRESKYNPRQYFDEKALATLTASVKSKGILNPLLVRPVGDHYEIMGGARRHRAAKAAGLKEVPVIVSFLSDVEALEVAVIDNLQRKDVHELEEADGFAALLKQPGYDVAAIAAKTGMSESHVYQRLKLTELVEPLKKAFVEGEITAGHAILLARLSPGDQHDVAQRSLFHDYWNGQKNVKVIVPTRQLAHHIATQIHRNLDAAPWKKDDAELLPKAGPCTTCPFRAGNQPELFSDVDRKDKVCTKPVCYDSKLVAFGERKFEAVRKEDKKAVKISGEYQRAPNGALSRNQYSTLGAKQKECPHTRQGVLVDGDKMGAALRVCTARDCKVHNTYNPSAPPSAAAKAIRQRELSAERKKKQEMAARRRIVQAIYEKVERLTREDLLLIAGRFEADVWYERRKYLSGLVGGEGNSYGKIDKQLAALDDKRLLGFILACALSQDIHSSYGGTKNIARAAKRHGVNAKKAGQEPPKEAKAKK